MVTAHVKYCVIINYARNRIGNMSLMYGMRMRLWEEESLETF